MEQIAFIGLGHMGQPMVQHLLKAGHKVTVYDKVPSAIQALESNGAIVGKSTIDTIQQANVIFTMLQTGEQVSEVAQDIFTHAKKNTLFIDSSSIDIDITQELHKKAITAGIAMLDAPVSGGVMGAQTGNLTFMVGGSEKNFARGKPVLEKMGKNIIHAGDAGCGQAAKICNNLILAISMIAVSEGFALAKKLNLDPKKFFEISSHSSSQCWAMTSYCPVPGLLENVPANHHYKPGFTSNMMLKDLQIAVRASEKKNVTIPLGTVATELYSLLVNQGHGELDFSAVIKMLTD